MKTEYIKISSIIAALFLIIGLAKSPRVYYTILRIVVCLLASLNIINESDKNNGYWIIIFSLILILFNPILPIYLKNKNI